MLEVVDVFSGLGLASSPCITHPDEFRLVFALDKDENCLECVLRSHPGVAYACQQLPTGAHRIPLPTADTHVHLSPPCHGISSARRDGNQDAKRESLLLLAWSIEWVLEFAPPTYSIEDVPAQEAVALTEWYKARHNDRIDYVLIDAKSVSAPQSRIRLVIGPPELIASLKEAKSAPVHVSIAEAFAAAGIPVPATHIKSVSGQDPKFVRSVMEQAHTVVASRAPTWCTSDGETVRMANVDEICVLMGAPTGLALPRSKKSAITGLGNGVSGQLALAILRAAAASNSRRGWVPPTSATAAEVEARCSQVKDRAMERVEHAVRKHAYHSRVERLVAEAGRELTKRQREEALASVVREVKARV